MKKYKLTLSSPGFIQQESIKFIDAESFSLSPDGRSITFHVGVNAVFYAVHFETVELCKKGVYPIDENNEIEQ